MGRLGTVTLFAGVSWTAPLVIIALILVLYLVYRIIWHPDFGLPVKRRILCLKVHVDKDQVAYVPFWWNNAQVQRALKRHWDSELSGKKSP